MCSSSAPQRVLCIVVIGGIYGIALIVVSKLQRFRCDCEDLMHSAVHRNRPRQSLQTRSCPAWALCLTAQSTLSTTGKYKVSSDYSQHTVRDGRRRRLRNAGRSPAVVIGFTPSLGAVRKLPVSNHRPTYVWSYHRPTAMCNDH